MVKVLRIETVKYGLPYILDYYQLQIFSLKVLPNSIFNENLFFT